MEKNKIALLLMSSIIVILLVIVALLYRDNTTLKRESNLLSSKVADLRQKSSESELIILERQKEISELKNQLVKFKDIENIHFDEFSKGHYDIIYNNELSSDQHLIYGEHLQILDMQNGEYFTPEINSAINTMKRIDDALNEFVEVTRLMKEKMGEEFLKEFEYTDWEIQNIGFNNFSTVVQYSLIDYKYIEAKLKYELGIYLYSFGNLGNNDLNTLKLEFTNAKLEALNYIKDFNFVD